MSVRFEQEGRAATPRRDEGQMMRGRVRPPRAEVNFERLRAPFSLRCGALLIDYILMIGVMALATLLARIFGDVRRGSAFVLNAGYITVAAVAFLNLVVVAGLSGRTLGKWFAGLRIERKDGVPVSFVRALVRHLIGYPLTLVTLGAGFLLAAFHPQGRALHDLIAGTVVVRSRGLRADVPR
jgi:uncharacterized RDD family membrane protein YckC